MLARRQSYTGLAFWICSSKISLWFTSISSLSYTWSNDMDIHVSPQISILVFFSYFFWWYSSMPHLKWSSIISLCLHLRLLPLLFQSFTMFTNTSLLITWPKICGRSIQQVVGHCLYVPPLWFVHFVDAVLSKRMVITPRTVSVVV